MTRPGNNSPGSCDGPSAGQVMLVRGAGEDGISIAPRTKYGMRSWGV